MITSLMKNPHVLYQKNDDEFDVAEAAIGASCDAGGLICLEQEGHIINVNRKSVPELCKLLVKLSKEPVA